MKIDTKSDGKPAPKRRRGRPRVLNQDENTAERRRTQIRLAQRAYRSRKEATISSLSQKNYELEAAIREMSISINKFQNDLIESGVLLQKISLAEGFQRIVQKSEALLKLSQGDQEYEHFPKTSPPWSESAGTDTSLPDAADDALFSVHSYSPPPPPPPPQTTTSNLEEIDMSVFGTTSDPIRYWDPAASFFQEYETGPCSQRVHRNEIDGSPSSSSTSSGSAVNMSAPTPSFTNGLPPISDSTSDSTPSFTRQPQPQPHGDLYSLRLPSTYSFLESSFARRIRRYCAEYAFRVLSDPNADPKLITRHFHYPLHFVSRQVLASRFSENLVSYASYNSTMDISRISPININIHIDDDVEEETTISDGEIINSSEDVDLLLMNSATLLPPVYQQRSSSSSSLSSSSLSSSCFSNGLSKALIQSGDWFDGDGVDSFLRRRGIELDAQTSFVALSDLSHSHSQGQGQDNTNTNTSSNNNNNNTNKPGRHTDTVDPYLMNLTATAAAAATANKKGQLDMSSSRGSISWTTPKQQSTRVFDVDLFLSQLAASGVCLGDRAGFRKEDVEQCMYTASYVVA